MSTPITPITPIPSIIQALDHPDQADHPDHSNLLRQQHHHVFREINPLRLRAIGVSSHTTNLERIG
jgi:hypothetical protein